MKKMIGKMQTALKNRGFYEKYFGSVGYLAAPLHRWQNRRIHSEEHSMRQKLAKGLSLTASQRGVVDELEANGFKKMRLSEIGEGAALLDYMASLTESYRILTLKDVMERRPGQGKNYWINMYDVSKQDNDPIRDLMANPHLAAIATAYLGSVPFIGAMEYFYSPKLETSYGTLRGSQNWHFDLNLKRQIKIFISPFAMRKTNGATKVFGVPESSRVNYKNYPDYFTDDRIEEYGLNPENIVNLEADPGEFYLVDSSRCLHCGSRTEEARFLLISAYDTWEYNLPPPKISRREGFQDVNSRLIDSVRNQGQSQN